MSGAFRYTAAFASQNGHLSKSIVEQYEQYVQQLQLVGLPFGHTALFSGDISGFTSWQYTTYFWGLLSWLTCRVASQQLIQYERQFVDAEASALYYYGLCTVCVWICDDGQHSGILFISATLLLVD